MVVDGEGASAVPVDPRPDIHVARRPPHDGAALFGTEGEEGKEQKMDLGLGSMKKKTRAALHEEKQI